jgi:hypothetical protein
MIHRAIIKRMCAVICLVTMLSACQSATYLALDAGTASAMSPAPVETIGIGKYSYRFTLVNTRSSAVLSNHPFSLTTFKESKYQPRLRQDGGAVYQGMTDRNGQTPTFQLNDKIPDKDFDLRERFGAGSHGVTFRLRSKTNGKTLAREDYFIVVCSDPIEYYSGYTDKNGDTGHVLSDGSTEAILYAGIRDEEFNYRKDCDEALAAKG